MMKIKIAEPCEIALIAELEGECFSHSSDADALKMFCRDGSFAVMLLENGRAASYCTVFSVLDEGQIIKVATRKECRGRGYAESVMRAVLEESQRRGLSLLSLEVRRSNAAAIALYGKLGFEIMGERKDFYRAPREDALVMIKNI